MRVHEKLKKKYFSLQKTDGNKTLHYADVWRGIAQYEVTSLWSRDDKKLRVKLKTYHLWKIYNLISDFGKNVGGGAVVVNNTSV